MNLSRIIRYAAFITAWAVALYVAAQLHRVDLGYVSVLCGRWGCLAPTSSVLGIHLMGLVNVAFGAGGVISLKLLSPGKVGRLLLWLGAGTVLAIVGSALYDWRPESWNEVARLLPFSIFSPGRVPAVPAIVVGMGILCWQRFGKVRSSHAD